MTQRNEPVEDPQVLLFARDVAKLNALRRQYERLVPAPVDTEKPGVTVRDATALFTDLRHFTHLAETFADDPATLLEVVNEHLTVVVNAVTRCAGIVEKFVGDGLLATFGARLDRRTIGNAHSPRHSAWSARMKHSTDAAARTGDSVSTSASAQRPVQLSSVGWVPRIARSLACSAIRSTWPRGWWPAQHQLKCCSRRACTRVWRKKCVPICWDARRCAGETAS